MSVRDEDPAGDASQKAAQMIAVAAVAAEAIAQVRAMRARERAERDERRVSALRAERHARYAQDRMRWEAILDPQKRKQANLIDTGFAWATAQGWAGDPMADQVSTLAEERLRDLRPDVMEHYDGLRSEGMDPVAAMTVVAPKFDQPRTWAGQAAPDRLAVGGGRGEGREEQDYRTPLDLAQELTPDSAVAGGKFAPSDADQLLAEANELHDHLKWRSNHDGLREGDDHQLHAFLREHRAVLEGREPWMKWTYAAIDKEAAERTPVDVAGELTPRPPTEYTAAEQDALGAALAAVAAEESLSHANQAGRGLS